MEKQLTETQIENLCIGLVHSSFFINDIALNCALDFGKEYFNKDPRYRHEIKRSWNMIDKECNMYESKIKQIYSGNMSFFADANEYIYNLVKNDIMNMEYSAKFEIDKAGIKDSTTLSKLATIQTMLLISIEMIKCNMGILNQYGRRSEELNMIKLNRVLDAVVKFSLMFYDPDKFPSLDVNACRNGTRIIIKKLANMGNISKAIEYSNDLNDTQKAI